jgi:hypothetical protein
VKLEERSALDWRFTDRNPHDKSGRPGSRGVVSPYGMQGPRPGSALPCPAGRSVPGRGGPERRRHPRPDGTGRAAAPHSRLAHETVVTEDGPYPLDELGAVASTCEVVVLVGRATRVP